MTAAFYQREREARLRSHRAGRGPVLPLGAAQGPSQHPPFPAAPSHTRFSSRKERASPCHVSDWLSPQGYYSLPWTPRRATGRGRRWLAESRAQSIRIKSTGTWLSSQGQRLFLSIAPGESRHGGFLHVVGKQLQWLQDGGSGCAGGGEGEWGGWYNIPKPSVTSVQKLPSAPRLGSCPQLPPSTSPWEPRGATGQPPATATHTVPRVPAKAGQTPTGRDVGLKSWNATRRHRGSPLCRELRPREQLALINITQENTPGGHLTFIEHLLCEGPTWGSRKKKSMQPSSCPGAHSLVGQTSRHSNSSEGAFSVTVLQRAYIRVFSTGNIQQHSHVVEKHIGINVNTATRLKGRTEITCSNSQLLFRARFSALFILF